MKPYRRQHPAEAFSHKPEPAGEHDARCPICDQPVDSRDRDAVARYFEPGHPPPIKSPAGCGRKEGRIAGGIKAAETLRVAADHGPSAISSTRHLAKACGVAELPALPVSGRAVTAADKLGALERQTSISHQRPQGGLELVEQLSRDLSVPVGFHSLYDACNRCGGGRPSHSRRRRLPC